MLLVRLIWRDSTHTTHRLSVKSCLELISEIGIGFVVQCITLLSSCAITINLLRRPNYKRCQWRIQDFPWGRGAPIPKVGVLTYFFGQKLHENERTRTPRGGRGSCVPGAPLDSPLDVLNHVMNTEQTQRY